MVGGLDFEIKSPGEYALDDLIAEIRGIQDALPEDMEIGVHAAGGAKVIHVESLKTTGLLTVFTGVDEEGREARLIQHFTQINVQVTVVPKLDKVARRIGFDVVSPTKSR